MNTKAEFIDAFSFIIQTKPVPSWLIYSTDGSLYDHI